MKHAFFALTLLLAAFFPTKKAIAQAEVGVGILSLSKITYESAYNVDPIHCRAALFQQFFSPDVVEYNGTFKQSGEPCTVTVPIDDAPPKLSISAPSKADQNRSIDLSEQNQSTVVCRLKPLKWMYWKFSTNKTTKLQPALRIDQINSNTLSVQILGQAGISWDKTAESCIVKVP